MSEYSFEITPEEEEAARAAVQASGGFDVPTSALPVLCSTDYVLPKALADKIRAIGTDKLGDVLPIQYGAYRIPAYGSQDKTIEACRSKFSNVGFFRGFPAVPEPEPEKPKEIDWLKINRMFG